MSHEKIRAEKICLNCGTETPGRFCPSCGQQNVDPKQTVWHLITHFFSDITHFDGKFFVTVKDLFAKPGFLSREYIIGRRASYLDPIRMYIFTSAFFFLIFFSIFDTKHIVNADKTHSKLQKEEALRSMLSGADNAEDSAAITANYNKNVKPFLETDSTILTAKRNRLPADKDHYNTVAAYDSAQNLLPVPERDGWFRRTLTRRKIPIVQNFQDHPGTTLNVWISTFLHNFPKALFISLPLFAILLRVLYLRRKQFYYVDHGIFALHLYIFSFLVMLVLFAINRLHTFTHWGWLQWLIGILCIYPFLYYYKAMRKFYGQSRKKTILKYALLLVMSLTVQLFIFVLAFLISMLEEV